MRAFNERIDYVEYDGNDCGTHTDTSRYRWFRVTNQVIILFYDCADAGCKSHWLCAWALFSACVGINQRFYGLWFRFITFLFFRVCVCRSVRPFHSFRIFLWFAIDIIIIGLICSLKYFSVLANVVFPVVFIGIVVAIDQSDQILCSINFYWQLLKEEITQKMADRRRRKKRSLLPRMPHENRSY